MHVVHSNGAIQSPQDAVFRRVIESDITGPRSAGAGRYGAFASGG
jgi:hypothetical protein